jgi:hypothetical protein
MSDPVRELAEEWLVRADAAGWIYRFVVARLG